MDPARHMDAGAVAAAVGVGLLVADVVLPVPSSVVMVAHGALFGVGLGAALSMLGRIGNAVVGVKVVRVDMVGRRVVDFAVNRISGGTSILPHEGFERPVDCRFGPDGCLYVADWGEMVPAPERAGVEIRLDTGVLWRIRPTGDRHGDVPPEPRVLPLNLLRAVVPTAAATAAAVVRVPGSRPGVGPGTASLRASPLERDELFILGPPRHRSQCCGAGRLGRVPGKWRSGGRS